VTKALSYGDVTATTSTAPASKEDSRKGEVPLKAPIQSRSVPRGPPESKTIEEDSKDLRLCPCPIRTEGIWHVSQLRARRDGALESIHSVDRRPLSRHE
jgi:hypothetical protein